MPVVRDCPSCGRKLRLPDTLAGRAQCPACNRVFPVGPGEGARPAPVEDELPEVPTAGEGRPASRPGGGLALVLGLLALGLAVPALAIGAVPSVSPFGLACSLPGFVLGIAGVASALTRRRGRTVAAVAAALNLVAVLVALGITAVTGGPFREVAETPGTPSVPKAPPPQPPEWGEQTDPDHDCSFREEGDALTISVPGAPHDLSAEMGRLNAPRTLREVTGDFTAEVTVAGNFQPAAPSTIPNRLPYNGAGLLLWHDASNYIRLERGTVFRDGRRETYATAEQRRDGRMGVTAGGPAGDQPTLLRLERRGNVVTASYRDGDGPWRPFAPLTVAYPAAVRVGVAAVNSSSQPFRPQFEGFRVTTP